MSELVDMNLPKNGAAANKLIAIPRSFAGNISAITPPALVNGDEPNEPAKKRRIIRESARYSWVNGDLFYTSANLMTRKCVRED